MKAKATAYLANTPSTGVLIVIVLLLRPKKYGADRLKFLKYERGRQTPAGNVHLQTLRALGLVILRSDSHFLFVSCLTTRPYQQHLSERPTWNWELASKA